MSSAPALPLALSSEPSPLVTSSDLSEPAWRPRPAMSLDAHSHLPRGHTNTSSESEPVRPHGSLTPPLSSSPTFIVGILFGTILLVWNHGLAILNRTREKIMDLIRHDSVSSSLIPSGMSPHVIHRRGISFSPSLRLLYIWVSFARPFACSHPFVHFTGQPRLSSTGCSVSTRRAPRSPSAKDGAPQRHDPIRSLPSSGFEYPSWVPVALWCPAVAARCAASGRALLWLLVIQSAYFVLFSLILRFVYVSRHCAFHSPTSVVCYRHCRTLGMFSMHPVIASTTISLFSG